MSEIELVFRRAEFRCRDLCFRCSYLKIVIHSNLQSILLNKKVDTCPLVDKNLSAWIELSVWRCKRCYEHLMVKFVPRAIIQYLIYACALLYKRELRKAVHQYNFPHCILRTETKASSAKDQRMYYMVTKYFHTPLNYQMNLRVSLCFLLLFVVI